jgi:hypothetical protein
MYKPGCLTRVSSGDLVISTTNEERSWHFSVLLLLVCSERAQEKRNLFVCDGIVFETGGVSRVVTLRR